MTKYFINQALENMDRFGGSFEQALAFCYSQADPDNQTILYNAFEHLFFKYARFKDD
tara:strand:+ start:3936 stop:4106 length:171 start_codon:yes stop_codon:yes gene_type:complete